MSAEIRNDYQEAIKLYVWYSPSKFSFFQGKANKELAERNRNHAQYLWETYLKPKKKEE